MTLTFNQISMIADCINSMQNNKLPFKLSLILAKDNAILKQETEFYIEREREFANKFLVQDENGQFVQTAENVFKIKEGMEEECREARVALDGFTTEVELRRIPMSLIESMEFTPKQMEALELLIDEEA
jgi:hypothetical protein